MPELPEVETVVRSLRPYLEGRRITDFERVWKRAIHEYQPARLKALILGRTIRRVERRAKFLVLALAPQGEARAKDDAQATDGAETEGESYLLLHLRMTGKLYPADAAPGKGERGAVSAIFTLQGADETLNQQAKFLVFEDQRRFGRVYYYPDAAAFAGFSERFGPEPLGPDFSPEWLRDSLRRRRRQLKPLLLDQEFVAGLGNIYVDESLWLARLHPRTPSDRVSPQKAKALHAAIREVLEASIRANGTTFLNFKFLKGKSGGYTDQLLVFSKTGQPCPRCKTPIAKLVVGQRGTHICPRCQPEPQ